MSFDFRGHSIVERNAISSINYTNVHTSIWILVGYLDEAVRSARLGREHKFLHKNFLNVQFIANGFCCF